MASSKKEEINLKGVGAQIIVTVYLCILVLSGYYIFSSYQHQIQNEEKSILDRLHSVTATTALNIDGNAHQDVFNQHTEKDAIPTVDFDSTYFSIQKQLKAIHSANNLTSPIYTAVYDTSSQSLLMGVTSEDKTFFRHPYSSYPEEVIANYSEGGSLPRYEDDFGVWLSAFSPIRNSKDQVIGIVQTDVKFDEFIVAAKKRLWKDVLFSIIALVVVSLLLFISLKSILKKDEKAKNALVESKQIIQNKQEELLDSINYAKRLQEAILPPQKQVTEYLQQSFILYKPKDIVAGDFYWMETVGDSVYFAAADCTGHGVPGAMVSVVCSNALSKALIEENISDVGKLLDRTRELVAERFGRSEENIQDGMDIALCALNTKTNKLHYAGANNPLWIIRKGAAEVEETKADKQPIGKYDQEEPFTTHSIELQDGDTLYIFSDGYPDQFGGDKGKKYKTGALKNFLLSIQGKKMTTQHQLLNEEFENWKGELEQIDDVCVIGVRI